MVSQAPDACTLPTADRPFRLAEWDELLTTGVVQLQRLSPERARLKLRADSELAARAAHLALRESQCCSFFEFNQTASGGELQLEIAVPVTQVRVLDALVDRAQAGLQPDSGRVR